MDENKARMDFYDYLKVTISEDMRSQYLDGYESFGWQPDEKAKEEKSMGKVVLHLKRDRRILNKTELTRLQRHYEACMEEIVTLEDSKHSVPTAVALSCGLLGCAFMAGSVFAVTAEPPIIWLCTVLAVPGFFLWGAAYFGYKIAKRHRTKKVIPLIEKKYDEAYEVCEKAAKLL